MESPHFYEKNLGLRQNSLVAKIVSFINFTASYLTIFGNEKQSKVSNQSWWKIHKLVGHVRNEMEWNYTNYSNKWEATSRLNFPLVRWLSLFAVMNNNTMEINRIHSTNGNEMNSQFRQFLRVIRLLLHFIRSLSLLDRCLVFGGRNNGILVGSTTGFLSPGSKVRRRGFCTYSRN